MSLDSYVRLLDWTARMLRSGERSTIPKDLASILDHMAIEESVWLETVDPYELFCQRWDRVHHSGRWRSGWRRPT
ncbi:MAG: hypothetical protein R6U98_37010 [Pirellulaceae bacterium]